MAIPIFMILPEELTKAILSCLGIKDLYRCKCVCTSWNKLIGTELIMIVEIFLRLPVKSLLRYKSVSKYCYNLISDMDFVRLHYKYQARLNPSLLLFLIPECHECPMFSARLNPSVVVRDDSSVYNDHHFREHDYPVKGSVLLSACNGLLCFSKYNYTDILFSYDPATAVFSKVPSLPYKDHRFTFSGFGYDGKDDDHKILTFMEPHLDAFIYSLRSNSWRKTTHYPSGIPFPCDGIEQSYWEETSLVFVNNAFHWLVRPGDRIMSFQLAGEQYHELPVPEVLKVRYESMGSQLSAPGGSHLHLLHRTFDGIDFWVMKEKYSWAKTLSFTCEVGSLPLAYLRGRSQILLGPTEKSTEEDVDFMSYELKTEKLRRVQIFDGLSEYFTSRNWPLTLFVDEGPLFMAVEWAESLFPLPRSNIIEHEDH